MQHRLIARERRMAFHHEQGNEEFTNLFHSPTISNTSMSLTVKRLSPVKRVSPFWPVPFSYENPQKDAKLDRQVLQLSDTKRPGKCGPPVQPQ
jgi:hypothetical protein